MYVKMERFIYLLFGADSSALRIDLRKIRLEDHEKIVKELLYVLDSPYGGLSEPQNAMPNLTELILKGELFFVKCATVSQTWTKLTSYFNFGSQEEPLRLTYSPLGWKKWLRVL